MEPFIGCEVNEKGQAGEVLRVKHDRRLYREFLAQLPAHSAIAVEDRVPSARESGLRQWRVSPRLGREDRQLGLGPADVSGN
jgi:hypothetical protein